MTEKTLDLSENFVENMEYSLFKSESEPPFHSRESIEDKLGILFAGKSESVQKKINNLRRPEHLRINILKLGSGDVLGKDLIEEEKRVLQEYSRCNDNDFIIAIVLENEHLNVKHLNYLSKSGNATISFEANNKLIQIFVEMKKFIIKENITADTWGNLSFDDLSKALIPVVKERFNNRCPDPSRRIEQLKEIRNKVFGGKEVHKKTAQTIKGKVETDSSAYIPLLRRINKKTFKFVSL